MSDEFNIRHVWKKQPIELADKDQIIKKAKRYKRKVLIRLIFANVTLVLTCVFIFFVLYYYKTQYITTKIGIGICVFDMLIYLAFYNTLVPLLMKKETANSVKMELELLKKISKKERFQQGKLLNLYFLLLYTGLGLYMYEYATRMTLIWAIFSYGIMFAWIALNAFYFRPRSIKKQQKKLNNVLRQLEEIDKQLKE